MRVLKKRSVAWCVLAAVILLSLSLSGGGALRDHRDETTEIFYLGVNGDGLSIDSDLKARAEAAKAYADAAGQNGGGEALVQAVVAAADELAAASGIKDKYRANAALDAAFDALTAEMKDRGLDKSKTDELLRHGAEFRSRADTIRRDVYNEKAAAFNEILTAFPASFVAMISGVGPVELFE